MATLGFKKPMVLNQLQYLNWSASDIAKMIYDYEDLQLEELRGHISDELYAEVERSISDRGKDEEARRAWATFRAKHGTLLDSIQTTKDINGLNCLIADAEQIIAQYAGTEVERSATDARDKARRRIEELQKEGIAAEWRSILAEINSKPLAGSHLSDMIAKVRNFISTHNPSSQLREEAERKLRELMDKTPPSPDEQLWRQIQSKNDDLSAQHQQTDMSDTTSVAQLIQAYRTLQNKVQEYIARFPSGSHNTEANELKENIANTIAFLEEEGEWSTLADRWRDHHYDYITYKRFHDQYPESYHNSQLDDWMWDITKQRPTFDNLNHYISDWPNGKHLIEALDARDLISEWEAVKEEAKKRKAHEALILVREYELNHPGSPFETEIKSIIRELREKVYAKMHQNPTKFDKDTVEKLIRNQIFSLEELCDGEIMTQQSWETLQTLNRDRLPDIGRYQVENPNITAPDNCTDIYFFGTPGTGKTCLLMGLAAANGNGYSLNMRMNGGPYASALQQYVNAKVTPGRTFGNYVSTINGEIHDRANNGKTAYHNVNFVEMSGEEFAFRIANAEAGDGQSLEASLSDMGTGATNLMRNNNRKVFFIVIDSSGDSVDFDYIEDIKDNEGFVTGQQLVKSTVSQLDILNKFVSLFGMPENKDIMAKVDAIHFIVTKADMLGESQEEREAKVIELLNTTYAGPVSNLQAYCSQTRRINYSTGYAPRAFTFSLGRFYLGDIFDFNNDDTLQIIDNLRYLTRGTREASFWDRFSNAIN